jgi:diamine N-acetyltransferase
MKITFRKASNEDIPLIKECLTDSWVEHARQEPKLLDEERMRQSKIDEYYQKALKSNESYVFIAEVDGVFAGFVKVDKAEISPFFRFNKILFIDDIYVLPEFRNKGVAFKLMAEVENIAKREEIKRIQARVYGFNKATQQLFSRMGYTSPHATWDKLL